MEYAEPAGRDGRGGLKRVDAAAHGLNTDEAHSRIVDEMVKAADGVRAAADARDHGIGQTSFLFEHLLLDLA